MQKVLVNKSVDVRLNTKVDKLIVEDGCVKGVIANNKKIYDLFIDYRRRKESAAINQLLSHSYVVTKIINDNLKNYT